MFGSFRVRVSVADAEEADSEESDVDSAEIHSRSSVALMNMQQRGFGFRLSISQIFWLDIFLGFMSVGLSSVSW